MNETKNPMKKNLINILLLLSLTLSACSSAIPAATETVSIAPIFETSLIETSDEEVSRPAGWIEVTHSNDAEPNYEDVFPEDKVNKIIITISPENWAAMQADMVALFGEQGSGTGQMGGAPDGGQPQRGERPEMPEGGDFQPPAEGERPAMPGGGGMGGGDMTPEDPMWVEAMIEFEGNT